MKHLLLPRWAVPQNNVALAQFYRGQVDEAIAIEEKVLRDVDRDNLHAIANLVLFHAVLGHREQAEAYGAKLEKLKPEFYDESLKMAQSFIWLGRDRPVYDILKKAEPPDQAAANERQWLLGIAAANLGRKNLAETPIAGAPISRRSLPFQSGEPHPRGTARPPGAVPILPRAASNTEGRD